MHLMTFLARQLMCTLLLLMLVLVLSLIRLRLEKTVKSDMFPIVV